MLSDAIDRAAAFTWLAAAAVLILGGVAVLAWIRLSTRLGPSRAAVQAAVDKATERASAVPPLPTRQPIVVPEPAADPQPALPHGVEELTAVWVARLCQGAVAHLAWAGQTAEGTPVVIRDERGHLIKTYGMFVTAEWGAQRLRLQWCLHCFPPGVDLSTESPQQDHRSAS
jgi:hypothetical protein